MPQAEVREAFLALGPLHGRLLAAALHTHERRALCGALLSDGPGLVMEVARALHDQPELFPDLPCSIAGLAEKQRLAFAWVALRDRLAAMARLAADMHLRIQAEATMEATRAVAQVHDGPAPAGVPEARRSVVMLPAMLVLRRYHVGLQRARERARRARKAAAPGMTTASTARTKPSRERVRARVREFFEGWLG